MPQTANEKVLDALVRHQIGLLRLSGSIRNRVIALLDATEADVRRKIERSLANAKPGDVVAGSAGYNRLRAVERSIQTIRSAAFERATDAWTGELRDLLSAETGFTAAAMAAAAPVILDLVIPDLRAVKSIVTTSPFQGRTLSGWASSLEDSEVQRIEQQLRIGIVEGEAGPELARRIVGTASLKGADGVTEITRQAADSITRTAVNAMADAAKLALYQENEDILSEEMYHATLDARTTVRCASLDGRHFKVGVGPRPPQHFRCRSVRIPVFGDAIGSRPTKASTERELLKEYSDKEGLEAVTSRDDLPHGTKGDFDAFSRRRVRELTGSAPATTTYGAFLKRQTNAFQDEVLGKTKAKLFRDGHVTLDRFTNRRGDELTLAQLAKSEAPAFRAAGLNIADFLG